MLRVECADCHAELHRIERGSLPAFEARLPCLNKACHHRLEEEPVLDDEHQLALSHLS